MYKTGSAAADGKDEEYSRWDQLSSESGYPVPFVAARTTIFNE